MKHALTFLSILTLVTGVAATRPWAAEPSPARSVTGQASAYAPPGPYRSSVQAVPDYYTPRDYLGKPLTYPQGAPQVSEGATTVETKVDAARGTAPDTAGTQAATPAVTTTTGGEATRQAGNPIAAEELAVVRAERRLYQLRVLQELLDDGILSADEEQQLRRRILAAGQ
jgi:hypothetical protein